MVIWLVIKFADKIIKVITKYFRECWTVMKKNMESDTQIPKERCIYQERKKNIIDWSNY